MYNTDFPETHGRAFTLWPGLADKKKKSSFGQGCSAFRSGLQLVGSRAFEGVRVVGL